MTTVVPATSTVEGRLYILFIAGIEVGITHLTGKTTVHLKADFDKNT